MHRQLIFIAILFALAFAAKILLPHTQRKRRQGAKQRRTDTAAQPDATPLPNCSAKPILNSNELHFFKHLKWAIKDAAHISCQVALIELIHDRQLSPAWCNKTAQKRVDFVLSDPTNMNTICVIELDGRSHALQKQIRRDQDKDAILRAAGIPILRIPTDDHYDLQQLRDAALPLTTPATTNPSLQALG